jgi:PAS domain S-box-containing protein
MVKQKQKVSGDGLQDSDQLAVFRETFASFNNTVERLNESYATLQSRYQQLSDELTSTNVKLREVLDQNLQTKNFLENVLESLTAGVITIDLEGRIKSINRSGCAILHIKSEQIIGAEYDRIFGKTLAGAHSLCDLLSGGEGYRDLEKDVRIDDGTVIPISASSAPINDGVVNTVGALEVFVDLTEVKRMQEEMARVRSLAALGEVAAVIAHEVRNPLSGIAGFAALLRDELGDDHPHVGYVDKISAGVQRLNRSVTSLLEYARDLRHEPRAGDLNSLVKETIDFFRMDLHARNSDAQVDLSLPAEPTVCEFDRENLGGALVNLLKNADEAMPSGGTISVNLAANDGKVMLSIADQGTSIPEEIREKIFAPFFTTRNGGTGLGLALVKKVVEAHRGMIEVDSGDGVGSTFTIFLPADSH